MRGDHAPWHFTILLAFDRHGGEADLVEVYRFVEERQAEAQRFGYEYLPSSQFEPTRWGGRPMYQHTVRSRITNRANGLIKRGLVEWVARGRYRLTEAGQEEAQELR